jgi:hypothetical protein
LEAGMTLLLWSVWKHHAFDNPIGAHVMVSPHQFHLRCISGPLLPALEQPVLWERADRLFEAAFPTGASCPLFYYAERGIMAIRTSAGLWCQSYEQGWPKTPPYRVVDNPQGLGLMVATALTPEHYPGLPFTLEAVEQAIPEAARPYVTIEWHPEDDLLPECAPDPRCVHDPANIGRWL